MLGIPGPGLGWKLPAWNGDLQRVCQEPPSTPGKLLRALRLEPEGGKGAWVIVPELGWVTGERASLGSFSFYLCLHPPQAHIPRDHAYCAPHTAPWVCFCHISLFPPVAQLPSGYHPRSPWREKCYPEGTWVLSGDVAMVSMKRGQTSKTPVCTCVYNTGGSWNPLAALVLCPVSPCPPYPP